MPFPRLQPLAISRGVLAASTSFGALGCATDPVIDEGPNLVSCADDPRLDVYTDNMEKEGELAALTFRFSDFEPAPPAKGSNTFHVQVSDSAGGFHTQGLEVSLIMPDHGHGTSVEPTIAFDPASNIYTVSPLYLFMPGVWRVTFDAAAAEAEPGTPALDRVNLHFCVEG